MRRMMTYAVSMMMALAMLMAPDMVAQTRSSGGGSTRSTSSQSGTTRSSGSTSGSSSSSRSSGSSSSSQVRSSSGSSSGTSRSSGSAVQQDNRSRSTGTTSSGSSSSRSSGSSTSGSSSSRSSGSTSSGSSSSTVRSSGSTSGSGVTSSYTDSQQDRNRNSGSTSGSSSTRSSGSTTSSGSSTSRSSGSTSTSGNGSTTRSSGSTGSSSGGSTVRSSGSTSTSGNGSTVRSSGSTSTNGNGSTVRSSGSTGSSSGSTVRSSGSTSATGGTVRSTNVSRSGLSYNAANDTPKQETYRDEGYNYRYHDDMRVDDSHNMYRVPPRQRDPMDYHRAGYFWGDHPHYYGYRVYSLPPSWRRINHWGIDYYYCDGIYYRSYGGVYVVCRPPYGTPLERAIDRAILRAIRFSYYCDTYRTYSRAFDYYNVIARQNLIIAQQNARLIAQNAAYAINSNRALTAYELAEKLGLVQSYAYANAEYYYQDGVFYTISSSGAFSTIVPPAGALVTSLPDDYEIIVMNGIEYYMVDNTVYRTTLFEGMPYLEVLGQMYGSLYNQYNVYR